MKLTNDFFADYDGAEIYYHPAADRLFIFHRATFLQLPCLEREDGIKMIIRHPDDVNDLDKYGYKLQLIGEL